jgi:hypothetical protein
MMNKLTAPAVVALALLLGCQPVLADITNNLVAYYDFECVSGAVGETVVDRSGHGHDGVCRENPSWLKAPVVVPGPNGLGEALNFDGAFIVQIPNHPDFNITDDITVAAWISVDDFTRDSQAIFCRGDWSWSLRRETSTDYAAFDMSGLLNGSGADGQTTNIRVPKRWVHLVGTYGNTLGAKLYINGILEAANTNVSGLININGNDPVTIGARIDHGVLSRQWQGQIDEVRLYNRALGAAEVAELYAFVLANSRPLISAPSDQVLDAVTNIQLSATVSDDGNPLPANPANPDANDTNKLRWTWSVISAPPGSSGVVWSGNPYHGEAFTYQGSPNPPGTVFTCSPTASFDVPGVYVLSFSAGDGQKTYSKNISVWIRSTNDYRGLGYLYLSPLPGSEHTSPQTRFVLVRFRDISPSVLTNLSTFVQVAGVQSGMHPGTAKVAGDGRTVIFTMTTDFTNNELVTVTLAPGAPPESGGPISPYQYQFAISRHMPGPAPAPAEVTPPSSISQLPSAPVPRKTLDAAAVGIAGIMPNGVSVPSDFPWISISASNAPDPDPIFISRGGGGRPYYIIFDNGGCPIWYMRTPSDPRELKPQQNGVLTMLVRDGGNHFNGFDHHYELVSTYWAGNGYGVDDHELLVLPDGTYLLVAVGTQRVDMSRYVLDGNTAAAVAEQVIQEFTPAGELIFQWRAWDHIDVRDQQKSINLRSLSFDFPHMNSIDIDTDGNILLSSRNTSEITKIDRDTGEIIWRLGGPHNQFSFVNDPLDGPRNQHTFRMVTTNDYTVLDNGNLHSPSMSRGVEYLLDTTNMTATLVWQYPNPATQSVFAYYMGNVQRLPNGNTLIDWAVGNLPKLTEVRPDGTKAFEMDWVTRWEAFRTWRYPWQASALKPSLIVEPHADNITLIFNQFGDTNVMLYRIYGGTAPQPTNLLATSAVTLKKLSNLENGSNYFFRVTAVNRQGVEGPFSNETNATVSFTKPGQNMVSNGDFSQGTNSWIWTLTGGATASWAIQSGTSHFYINNSTALPANIQLKQTGKTMVLGNKYVLQFDAWSAAPRYIEARVLQEGGDSQVYTSFDSPYLTPVHNRFQYVFTMSAITDLKASLVFNLGGSPYGVFLDNINLFNPPTGDLNLDGNVDLFDLQIMSQNWLKQQSGLSGDLDSNGKADFYDLEILGENWSRNN